MFLVVTAVFALLIAVSEGMVKDRPALILLRIYLGWWGFCLAASALDPLSMYPVSGFTYSLLLLNVCMFTAGFIVVGRGREATTGEAAIRGLSRSFKAVSESRAVLVALLVFFFYLLRYFLRYQAVLGDLGPSEARNIRFSIGTLFGSALEVIAFNYFAEALATGLAVFIGYSLVLGSVRTWAFLLAIVDLYLFTGIGAGRTLIVELGIFVVLLAMLRDALGTPRDVDAEGAVDAGAPAPVRKNLLVFVGLPVLLMTASMIYLTIVRIFSLEAGLELLKSRQVVAAATDFFLDNLQVYTVGPFRALDQAVQHPSQFGTHFGRLTLGAVDEIIGYPFRMLGYDYPIANHQVGERTQDVIFIGSGDFNALYTGVFRFYFDLGVAGVALFGFLLGSFVRATTLWFQSSPSLGTLAILLFLMAVAILSTQTWHLASPSALVFLAGATLLQRLEAR